MIKRVYFGLVGERFYLYDQVICRKLQVRSPFFLWPESPKINSFTPGMCPRERQWSPGAGRTRGGGTREKGGAHQREGGGTRGRRWRAEAHAREATVVGDKGERRHAGRRRRLGARAGGGARGRRRRCKRQKTERRDSRGSSSAANGWGAGGKGAAGKSAGKRRERPGDAAAPSIKTTALSRTGQSAARRCRCRCRRSGGGGPCWRNRVARRCAGRPGS